MQGYLYIEVKRGDTQALSFSSRYFISFPFCGLKWFREEPTGETYQRLLVDNNMGGWVYGGSITIRTYAIEAATIRQGVLENYVYPFVLEIQDGEDEENTRLVRLASDDEDTRANWIEELQRMIQIQNYLFACQECNALPSSNIFFAHDYVKNTLQLERIQLNTNSLGSVVMASKLSEPDGSMLQRLHLENVQLADRHAPLVATFLSFAPHLESLSLCDNFITCVGLTELSEAIPFCRQLTYLNLSSNFIADKGATALSASLSVLKRLQSFDISRNRLTEAVTKSLALYLARHDSELSYVNFAYNPMGDSIATLIALLMTNQPSHLEIADISYCSIGEAGAAELVAAIPFCSSIKMLRLNGNFADAKTTGRLVAAVSHHYEKYGRFQIIDFKQNALGHPGGTGLNDRHAIRRKRRAAKQHFTVTFGGVNISQDLMSLPKQVMRTAVTHIGDRGIAGSVVLRRRASLFQTDATLPPSTSRLKQRLAAMSVAQQPGNNQPFVCSNGIGCVRVKLSYSIDTVHDVLSEIARAVGAHPRQLVLLSASSSAESRICFILFSPLNPTLAMLQGRHRAVGIRHAASRGYYTDRAQRQLQKKKLKLGEGEPKDITTFLPTAQQLLQRFLDLCRLSDGKVRRIGIMSIFLYMPGSSGSGTATDANGFTSVSLHVNATNFHASSSQQVASMSGEIYDYLPSLYPSITYNDRGEDGRNSDDDDDVYVSPDGARSDNRKGGHRRRHSHSGSYDYEEDEDEGRGDLRKMDTFDDIFGVDAQDVEVDEDMGASVEKSILKDLDVRMVSAIAESYEEAGAIDSDSAHFWEGVFGVPKWLKYTEAVIMAPVQEEGVFRAVAMRKRLCDAMFKRDVDQLSQLMDSVKKLSIPGGNALVLADIFLAELLTLKHSSESLPSLAQGPDDIHIVEKFLLTCARLGYAGPETFAAVELREFLVRWALNENASEFEHDLEAIQRRAMLTNMMISRNMKELKSSIESFDAMKEEDTMVATLEIKAAKILIENEAVCMENLKKATEARSLELIEEAISEAAYHNMYDEEAIRAAICIMLELGGDSRGLFIRVNNAIRQGSHEVLDKAIMEVRRVGWSHSALSSPVLTRILGLRNRILQEEITKARVIKVADTMSETSNVSNPAEVLQLLRRVRLLKLENDPSLRESLSLMQSKMRHITGVQHQEEAIIKLLEEKNVAKLSELLSGRGQGKLVMAASSPEVMNDWLDALLEVCTKKVILPTARSATNNKPFAAPLAVAVEEEPDAAPENTGTVVKAGSLEKAARGNEGVLRNWRLRYFVLQGDDLSYYTKLGGEKKGTIRVTGGAVRLLPLAESSGHHNCIELQEGRDLSMIDPELLDEVRKQVNIFRRDQLEDELAKAISIGSEERLAAALESASSYGISLDGELVVQARSVLMREQHKKLKLDLRDALVTLPRRRLQELIRTAKRVRLDPNNTFLRRAFLHMDKSDVELTLLRARTSMGHVEDAVFKRSMATVQQLDAKRLTIREKYLLVAVLLQWTGYTVLRTLVQGSISVQHCIHVLNQVLASTIVYYIETEPMQLARTVLEGLKTWLEGSEIDNILNENNHQRIQAFKPPERGVAGTGVSKHDLSQQFQGANNAITFSLERFPQLNRKAEANQASRGHVASKDGKSGLFGFLGGSAKKLDAKESSKAGGESILGTSLSFTADTIHSPVTNVGRGVESKIPEMFEGLQVVMLDRPLAQFAASQAKSRNSFFSRADISSIAKDLVSTGVANEGLRDELYLQICKQVNKNPKAHSRYYGWCMFSIYLNCFPPSFGLLPYLKTYVAESLVFESKQNKSSGGGNHGGRNMQTVRRRFSVARSSVDEEGELSLGTTKLIAYSTKLLNNIERTYARGMDSVVYLPTNRALSEFLNSAVLEFEIVAMTGSVYRICLTPSDIDSPLSLLYALYKQLVTGMDAPTQADYGAYFAEPATLEKKKTNIPATGASSAETESITSTSVTDVLLRTFRGFSLYRAEGDGGFAGELSLQRHKSLSESAVFDAVEDLDEIPVNSGNGDAPRISASTNFVDPLMWCSDLLEYDIQPSEKKLIDWGEDLMWELLIAGSDIGGNGSPSREDESPVQSHRKQSFIRSPISPSMSVGSNIAGTVRKRFILRKRTSFCTEVFSDQFQMFEDSISDRDIVTSKKLWTSWLTSSNAASAVADSAVGEGVDSTRTTPVHRGSVLPTRNQSIFESRAAAFVDAPATTDTVLPPDHIRMDLLFAEESRYVNAQKYIRSTASQAYLNALQLVLSCYSDKLSDLPVSAKHWGSGHHAVLSNTGLSVRPCLQSKPTVSTDTGMSPFSVDGHLNSENDSSSSTVGGGRRGSILGMNRRISFSNRTSIHETTESPFSTALKTTSHDGQPHDDAVRRGSGHMYVGDTSQASVLTKPLSMADLSEANKAVLVEACQVLGISVDEEEDFPQLVNWIGQFQSMALSAGVSILSPRFRYMIKRAYLGYLVAFPLYGSHFFDALLMGTHMDSTTMRRQNNSATDLAAVDIPISAPAVSEDTNKPLQAVCLAINGEGVHLVSPDCRESIFVAPLFDITSMNVLPPVRTEQDVFAAEDELDAKFTLPLFSMNVNGMEVQLLSKEASQIKKIVEAFCLEALARGSFPHGTEGGNDVYEIGSSFVPASDQKELMNKFLHDFPLLPNPPPPPVLPKSSSYFSAPLSRRAILAEERAEEERRELELSKRAAESHVAKHMEKLETGRQALSRIMSEDEEEDDDDLDQSEAAQASRERSRAAKEDLERMRQERVSAALCGVSNKLSNVSVDVIEPFNARGGMLSPGDYGHYDRGKFHPPPLLRDAIEKKAATRGITESELGTSPDSVALRYWPSDVKLAAPPKQFMKVGAIGGQWATAMAIHARNMKTADSETQHAMQLINGVHYEHTEYLSRSMQAVTAHTEENDEFDMTEEGVCSTAVSMTHPAANSSPNRRGSVTAYSNLMRRNSTGLAVAPIPETDEDDTQDMQHVISTLGEDDDGSTASIGNRKPSFSENQARKKSIMEDRSKTLETFSEEFNHEESPEGEFEEKEGS